jgi:hypothetical protein
VDHIRDYERFKTLVTRLCDTMRGGKNPTPTATNELVESWWKALRHCEYGAIEVRIEDFLANADDTSHFPRPAQMRPPEQAPPPAGTTATNPTRDYWRSVIVTEVARCMSLTPMTFEPVLVANKDLLGRPMLQLLDEICDQHARGAANLSLHQGCIRQCGEIVRGYRLFRGEGVAA